MVEIIVRFEMKSTPRRYRDLTKIKQLLESFKLNGLIITTKTDYGEYVFYSSWSDREKVGKI